jgi:hypothetical protein
MHMQKTKIKACKTIKLVIQAYWKIACFMCCKDNQKPLEVTQLLLKV